MQYDRRQFLVGGVGALASMTLAQPSGLAMDSRNSKIRAACFDAFTTFDPRPIFSRPEEFFPGRGAEFGAAWRNKIFQYMFVRAAAGQFAGFPQVADEALTFVAKDLQLPLDPSQKAQLLDAFMHLQAWPDAAQALTALKDRGVRLAFLSNLSEEGLRAAVKNNAGLDGLFDHYIATERARTYKPDPKAYQLGVDTFGYQRHEIVFVAFGSWDAFGAKSFGYPTFWVNRANATQEELANATPEATGPNLLELVTFVNNRNHGK
jgi:2-haloacid dehalogenase